MEMTEGRINDVEAHWIQNLAVGGDSASHWVHRLFIEPLGVVEEEGGGTKETPPQPMQNLAVLGD